MNSNKVITGDYQLEQARLDWLGLRSQIIVGLLAVFCLCCANSFFMGWRLADLILSFAACLFTALITLEITGRFGNRLRASAPLWAAMLMAVSPDQVSADLLNRASGVLILLALFFLLRSRTWRGRVLPLILLAGGFCLSLYTQELNLNMGNEFSVYILISAYCISVLILLIRLFLRTLSMKKISCIFIPILFLMGVMSCLFHWKLVVYACLACWFSLSCLPCIDAISRKSSRIIAGLGIGVLLVVVVIFEHALISVEGISSGTTEKISFFPLHPKKTILSFDSSCFGKVIFFPEKTKLTGANEWYVSTLFQPTVEKHIDFMRIFPGNDFEGVTVILKTTLNPLMIKRLVLQMHCHDFYNQLKDSSCQLIWRNSKTNKQYKCNWSRHISGDDIAEDKLIADLSKDMNWIDGKQIQEIGLHFGPGNYCFDLYSLGCK